MTIQKPNIVWQGSPNFNTGHPISPTAPDPQTQQAVVSLVDHITEGNRNSVKAKFQDPNSEASTHFLVNTDGSIWQFVALGDSAWGNGIWEVPDTSVPWINDAYNSGKWANGCTISIEHEGTHGVPLTEPQYQATLALQRYLLSYFKLPADRNHIVGHYQIQSKNRANCPGSAYPWTRLIGDLQVFNPNPNNYAIGKGMLDELIARKLTAATPENYLTVQPGMLPQSELYTVEGPILKGIKKPDNSGSWLVKVINPL